MTATLLIHGYNWDIDTEDPEYKQYWFWRLFATEPAIPYNWQSSPTWRDSWRNGRVHRYHRAWDMAADVGLVLRQDLLKRKEPVNIICHSLGARVVLQALKTSESLPVKRVLIFNGSESSRNASHICCLQPNIEFYSVVVKADGVLRWFGGLGTPGKFYENVIGLHGVKGNDVNWHDLFLGAAGDFPGWGSDHNWSWRNPANIPIWKEVLAGKFSNTPTPKILD